MNKKETPKPIDKLVQDQYLVNKIFESLGFDLSIETGILMDQDYMKPVYIYDKILLYRPDLSCTDRRKEIIFNPSDKRQLKMIFNFYLKKIKMFDDRETTMFFDFLDENKNTHTCIAFGDGERICSDSYYNESLRYIDLIFKIAGQFNMYEYLKKYDDEVVIL